MSKLRPLANIGYLNAQSPTNVIASPSVPQKSTGLVNKAMDLFFGW
jgi:nuclear pore complex protein Nup53